MGMRRGFPVLRLSCAHLGLSHSLPCRCRQSSPGTVHPAVLRIVGERKRSGGIQTKPATQSLRFHQASGAGPVARHGAFPTCQIPACQAACVNCELLDAFQGHGVVMFRAVGLPCVRQSEVFVDFERRQRGEVSPAVYLSKHSESCPVETAGGKSSVSGAPRQKSVNQFVDTHFGILSRGQHAQTKTARNIPGWLSPTIACHAVPCHARRRDQSRHSRPMPSKPQFARVTMKMSMPVGQPSDFHSPRRRSYSPPPGQSHWPNSASRSYAR